MALPPTGPTVPSFTAPPRAGQSNPLLAWIGAGIVVLLLLAGGLLLSHRAPRHDAHTVLPLDPYASSLVFSKVALSESTSLSGGKSTFIDGHVHNTGPKTLSGATLQVLFPADQPPPQLETVPLTLIRTHQPYVDTEPLSAAPLAPGADQEFRLIFENIRPEWNQQMPEIHLVQATLQ